MFVPPRGCPTRKRTAACENMTFSWTPFWRTGNQQSAPSLGANSARGKYDILLDRPLHGGNIHWRAFKSNPFCPELTRLGLCMQSHAGDFVSIVRELTLARPHHLANGGGQDRCDPGVQECGWNLFEREFGSPHFRGGRGHDQLRRGGRGDQRDALLPREVRSVTHLRLPIF
jgi:hypothetical protein